MLFSQKNHFIGGRKKPQRHYLKETNEIKGGGNHFTSKEDKADEVEKKGPAIIKQGQEEKQ